MFLVAELRQIIIGNVAEIHTYRVKTGKTLTTSPSFSLKAIRSSPAGCMIARHIAPHLPRLYLLLLEEPFFDGFFDDFDVPGLKLLSPNG